MYDNSNQLKIINEPKISVITVVFVIYSFGLVFLYDAIPKVTMDNNIGISSYLSKQIVFGIIGLVFMFIAYKIPLSYIKKYGYHILVLGLLLMLSVFIPPISVSAGGATRWIGMTGLTFQPSEFMKLAFIIYLSKSLPQKGKDLHNFTYGFLPYLIILFIITVILLAQKDLGSIIVMGIVLILMLFVGGVPFRYLFSLVLLISVIGGLGIFLERYRLLRVIAFFNPWKYSETFGYQQTQSFLAYANGGITGKAGGSLSKLYYLPKAHTDFIFSIVGEDGGLLVVTLFIILFGLLLYFGFKIAEMHKDRFGMLMAFGITALLGTEIIINISVTVGLLPNKGLPLPFISYGGSNLLMSFIMVGLLANLGRKYE